MFTPICQATISGDQQGRAWRHTIGAVVVRWGIGAKPRRFNKPSFRVAMNIVDPVDRPPAHRLAALATCVTALQGRRRCQLSRKKPWDSGTKVWHDTIAVLDRPGGSWRVAEAKLPRPLGYGVSMGYGVSIWTDRGFGLHRRPPGFPRSILAYDIDVGRCARASVGLTSGRSEPS